jgi:hypothetical protein
MQTMPIYFTVIIPYVATGRTEWHPTEPTGPFSKLSRGAFPSKRKARAWALSKGIRRFKLKPIHAPKAVTPRAAPKPRARKEKIAA